MNYWSFEALRNAIGEPLTVEPIFTWLCGCLATPVTPGDDESLIVTPCAAHKRRIRGDLEE